jgi:hypothetical protein
LLRNPNWGDQYPNWAVEPYDDDDDDNDDDITLVAFINVKVHVEV